MVLVLLALVLFLVAGVGLTATKAHWEACVAFGLALVALAQLWPHLAGL